jgi:hypothetical protein
VSDKNYRLTAITRNYGDPLAQLFNFLFWAPHVEIDSRRVRTVADSRKPLAEWREKEIPGEEAGNQKNRPTVSSRDAYPIEERIT